jgi:hypothetical protein
MSLSELIAALKRDLWKGHLDRADDIPPMFKITEAQIEASVYFERSFDAGGEIGVWVAKFSPKVSETSQALHKFTCKLEPLAQPPEPPVVIGPDGKPTIAPSGGGSPLIRGKADGEDD